MLSLVEPSLHAPLPARFHCPAPVPEKWPVALVCACVACSFQAALDLPLHGVALLEGWCVAVRRVAHRHAVLQPASKNAPRSSQSVGAAGYGSELFSLRW